MKPRYRHSTDHIVQVPHQVFSFVFAVSGFGHIVHLWHTVFFTESMRIYLNRSLNKHFTGGTRVTMRRQLPIVRPGCCGSSAQTGGDPARSAAGGARSGGA